AAFTSSTLSLFRDGETKVTRQVMRTKRIMVSIFSFRQRGWLVFLRAFPIVTHCSAESDASALRRSASTKKAKGLEIPFSGTRDPPLDTWKRLQPLSAFRSTPLLFRLVPG